MGIRVVSPRAFARAIVRQDHSVPKALTALRRACPGITQTQARRFARAARRADMEKRPVFPRVSALAGVVLVFIVPWARTFKNPAILVHMLLRVPRFALPAKRGPFGTQRDRKRHPIAAVCALPVNFARTVYPRRAHLEHFHPRAPQRARAARREDSAVRLISAQTIALPNARGGRTAPRAQQTARAFAPPATFARRVRERLYCAQPASIVRIQICQWVSRAAQARLIRRRAVSSRARAPIA